MRGLEALESMLKGLVIQVHLKVIADFKDKEKLTHQHAHSRPHFHPTIQKPLSNMMHYGHQSKTALAALSIEFINTTTFIQSRSLSTQSGRISLDSMKVPGLTMIIIGITIDSIPFRPTLSRIISAKSDMLFP